MIEAVKDSPISWDIVETLLEYGAKIYAKNHRNICALDLVPELARFQQFCLEELVQAGCCMHKSASPRHSTISSILHGPTTFFRSSTVGGGAGGSIGAYQLTQGEESISKRPSVSHYNDDTSSHTTGGQLLVGYSRKTLPYFHRKFRNLRDGNLFLRFFVFHPN